jgi:UDP-N-acetylmuramate: L-alanyl-gamma-D-glutamyl-meso-diaminopimelate ligase
MKVHFIAIGGSVMHSLAIELHKAGHQVSGSDDKVYEPSLSRLNKYGLLPDREGWVPEKISRDLDYVIAGMHAKPDNPELLRCKELGIKVYSFPEFFREYQQDRQRIVIAGSHGKTTITAMISHVLSKLGIEYDFLVGANLEAHETSVKLTPTAPIALIEGDEYGTSPLDPSPKFLHYHHHIGVISGVAWDHFNIYPTFEQYLNSFRLFAEATPRSGHLIYNGEDEILSKTLKKWNFNPDATISPYTFPKHKVENGLLYLFNEAKVKIPMRVFGKHNLSNMAAAFEVCKKIRINEEDFIYAISNFKGAPNRLELVAENTQTRVFRDFAHAPSKLEATVRAVKEQFPRQKLVACYELHTFSSLNKAFLPQYKGKFRDADLAYVYFDPKVVEAKKLEPISIEEVQAAFQQPRLKVITDPQELEQALEAQSWRQTNLLMMSSGNFGGLDLNRLVKKLIPQ